METPLGRVLDVGTKFFYEYDFGSTTELGLKVVGFWNQDKPKGAVQLLARNEPPQIICVQCETQPATQVCTSARNLTRPGFANRARQIMSVVRRCSCRSSTLPALECVPILGNRSGGLSPAWVSSEPAEPQLRCGMAILAMTGHGRDAPGTEGVTKSSNIASPLRH